MPKVTIRPAIAAPAAHRQAWWNSSGYADDVVGGQHEHERLGITFLRKDGGDRDRWPRIATHRFEYDIGLDALLAQLLGYYEAKFGVGDDDRP